MARVTVEDCVVIVPNRFELCLIASNRAKSILSGAATTLDRKEKPAVIALREIADRMVETDNVRANIVRNIKNRGTITYDQLVEGNSSGQMPTEEIENKELVLKEDTFVDENIEVDD